MFKPPPQQFLADLFKGGGSDVVLCCLFLVSEFRRCFTLCLIIILLVRFRLLSDCDHLLGNSCPLGWPFVLVMFCLFVIFFYIFERGICLLIVPVPVHCFLNTFYNR